MHKVSDNSTLPYAATYVLRKNSVVEQAVQAWKEARLLILDLSKARHRQSSASPSVLTPSRKPTPPTPSNKKRKRTPIPIDDDIVEIPEDISINIIPF
ncbi:hypothetical protein EW026_g5112 [Hermanssonia centrifuga]|uniref:Uncharacterized protein n=1 Tax=Hermanssonia centrifuga TaxID=98765 RepID=A0A4S4KG07_9APHY|nr:hypothetical protein EW026_g5112 [Hermanssonia centrifuga]